MSETQDSSNVGKYILAGGSLGLAAVFAWKYGGNFINNLFKKETVNFTELSVNTLEFESDVDDNVIEFNNKILPDTIIVKKAPNNNLDNPQPSLKEEADCAIMMLALNTETTS